MEDIPLEEITLSSINNLSEEFKSIHNNELLRALEASGLTVREIVGLDKAIQTYKGELQNNLGKLSKIETHIAYEKEKLKKIKNEGYSDEQRKSDTSLGEKIRTLFREQRITIVSILTAFGLLISTIVGFLMGGGRGGGIPTTPPQKGGAAE